MHRVNVSSKDGCKVLENVYELINFRDECDCIGEPAILRMVRTQQRLKILKCMQLESLILKGIAEAKRNIQAQRRERALLYLRKNKVYDHSLKNIDDYLLNVEQAGCSFPRTASSCDMLVKGMQFACPSRILRLEI